METINGVTILFNGKPIEEEDGYVGQLTDDKAALDIYIERGREIHGFAVDGKKNVIPRKNVSEAASDGYKAYRTGIQIKVSLEGTKHTEYPDNNIRLLEVLPAQFRIWEVALVSQGGDFFVAVQKTYEAYCYCDGEKFSCPQFDDKWPQLGAFLEKLFEGKEDELPPLSSWQPEPETSAEGFAPKTGKVLWFNFAQGVGAIITPKGTARVHWTQVAKRGRRAYLLPGESVRYASLKAPQNTKLRASSFPNEAVRVKAL